MYVRYIYIYIYNSLLQLRMDVYNIQLHSITKSRFNIKINIMCTRVLHAGTESSTFTKLYIIE